MAKSSFLPEDYVERRAQNRANIICMILFVLVMAGIIGAFVVRMREAAAEQRDGRRVDGLYDDAAKRLEQFDELEHKKEEMIHKARVTSALLERVPRSIILSELINNMPIAVSLIELDLETHVTQVPIRVTTALDKAKLDQKKTQGVVPGAAEVKETETVLNLLGVAPTDVQVAQYMTALSRSPLFTDVNLAYSEEATIDEHNMRRFRIDLKINPDVDVQKINPTMVKRNGKVTPLGGTVSIDPNGKLVTPVEKPAAKKSGIVNVGD